MRTYEKDANELLDYLIDYSRALANGDIIVLSTWEMDAGAATGAPVIEATQSSDTVTTIWLSGGVDGQQYVFRNDVTTNDGRRMTRRIKISVNKH